MATGALYGRNCLSSQAEALDAYYSSALPAFTSGITNYYTEFNKVGGVWKHSSYTVNDAGVQTLRYTLDAPIVTFPTCQTDQSFTDGLTIGWGIAAAMILVAALKLMERAK